MSLGIESIDKKCDEVVKNDSYVSEGEIRVIMSESKNYDDIDEKPRIPENLYERQEWDRKVFRRIELKPVEHRIEGQPVLIPYSHTSSSHTSSLSPHTLTEKIISYFEMTCCCPGVFQHHQLNQYNDDIHHIELIRFQNKRNANLTNLMILVNFVTSLYLSFFLITINSYALVIITNILTIIINYIYYVLFIIMAKKLATHVHFEMDLHPDEDLIQNYSSNVLYSIYIQFIISVLLIITAILQNTFYTS